jgi:plastocyanin
MKRILLAILIFNFFFILKGNSTTFTIQAGYMGQLVFFPNSITNAQVGDTIKFLWSSGSHTTTSVTVPSGAATWDHPMTSTDTVYKYVITVAGVYMYKCTPHLSFGMAGTFTALPSGIHKIGTVVNEYQLAQNYPNPFNPVTAINFSIPQNNFVSLKIYDVSGKEIQTIVNGELPSGSYKYIFDASSISSGIYFYKLASGDFVDVKRMALIK